MGQKNYGKSQEDIKTNPGPNTNSGSNKTKKIKKNTRSNSGSNKTKKRKKILDLTLKKYQDHQG